MDNPGIILRQIEKKDNAEIASLIRKVFREFKIDKPGTVYFDPTTDDLYKLFRKPGSVYWIAFDGTEMIGGCGIYPTPDLPIGCAELVKFYLASGYRGKGIGRMLMYKSIESARELGYKQIYLESMPELGKAISMYEKAGFRSIDHPMGHSGHFGCDIWMLLDL
ncbi:MAG TPA: GNAT family N-acetyltransferase [Bacteroidales bacterium]|nr:GNAT family N-acetyltransferase [Bacteroidales bacterium]